MEKNGFAVPRTDPAALQPRRKYVPPSFNTLYFRDSILSVPGYVFEKVGYHRSTCIQCDLTVKQRQHHGKIREA
jgi:hypothetical protein